MRTIITAATVAFGLSGCVGDVSPNSTVASLASDQVTIHATLELSRDGEDGPRPYEVTMANDACAIHGKSARYVSWGQARPTTYAVFEFVFACV